MHYFREQVGKTEKTAKARQAWKAITALGLSVIAYIFEELGCYWLFLGR